MSKFSVGNPLLLHYFRVPKKFGEEGGGIKIFRRSFLFHSAENFRRESFTVALIWGIKKFWTRGDIKTLRRKVFVSQCRKFP